jgi:fumarate reductase flavoprotein subunit
MEARPVPSMGGNFIVPMSVINNFGTLWVDNSGRRYCNEGFGDPVFAGMPAAALKHGTTTVIFDSSIVEDLQHGTLAHGAYRYGDEAYDIALKDNMAAARKAGAKGHEIGGMTVSRLYSADSLETLADYIGFNGTVKQNFLDTVKRYNQFAAAGRDEDFGKNAKLLNAIDAPPYYAQPTPPMGIGFFLCTVGGLLTDEYQNVLNQKKDPIPGLYATGNCCGRRYGPQYSTPISGVSIGICLTLGREAGKIVASL